MKTKIQISVKSGFSTLKTPRCLHLSDTKFSVVFIWIEHHTMRYYKHVPRHRVILQIYNDNFKIHGNFRQRVKCD